MDDNAMRFTCRLHAGPNGCLQLSCRLPHTEPYERDGSRRPIKIFRGAEKVTAEGCRIVTAN